jgi:nitrate/nitrite transport system ATP-binding protein
MAFLELKNVKKTFQTSKGTREILGNVSLTIEEGEFVCIVGYSGAGKTTLINLIAGLIEPDEGEILLQGKKINGTSLERGLIFQNYSLLPWLSALRNVELAVSQCCPSASAQEVKDRSIRYLEMVKLGHALDRKPSELSGGMKQRVSLARGLAMEPKILLLDEPLGALDALTRSELQNEFVRIQEQQKKTILMITNDVDEGILVADRIIPLSAGPSATLGEPLKVSVARPRDRKQMNHDPLYHHDRKIILNYLLAHGPSDLKAKQKLNPSGSSVKPTTAWEAAATA